MYSVTHNADLTKLTTFGTPAGCGCLVEYRDLDDLRRLAADEPGLLSGEVFCLGGGSNVLFLDEFYCGTVLRCVGESISEVKGGENGRVRFVVQAGLPLDALVGYAVGKGLWGLENLAAIPGCIGGAAVQNVGAYGAEFSQSVVKVNGFDLDTLQPVSFSKEECAYGYRQSVFKKPGAPRIAIYEVEVELSRIRAPRLGYAGIREALSDVLEDEVTPAQIAEAVRKVRAAKLPDPAVVGSAGSYFKNPVVPAAVLPAIEESWEKFCTRQGAEHLPLQYHQGADGAVKLSAAWMIDKGGCKGFAEGGASLWPTQPLVIVNRDGTATAGDVVALQRRVQRRVEEAFGVLLIPEVVKLGDNQQ